MVQFSPGDGRIIEQAFPEPRKAAALQPGRKVLVWYGPGRSVRCPGLWPQQGTLADALFIAAGTGLIIAGAAIAGFGS